MTAFDAPTRPRKAGDSPWRGAFAIVADQPGVLAAAIVAVGIVVCVAVLAVVAAQEVRLRTSRAINEVQASVFLHPQTPRADAESLKGRLAALPFVGAATLRTKEEALAGLDAASPQTRGRPNPLPDVWVVTLRFADREGTPIGEQFAAAREALARLPEVASVDLDMPWIAALERWRGVVVKGYSYGIVALFAVVALLEACMFLLTGRALVRERMPPGETQATGRGALFVTGAIAGVAALFATLAGLAIVTIASTVAGLDWKPTGLRVGQDSGWLILSLCVMTLVVAATSTGLAPRR